MAKMSFETMQHLSGLVSRFFDYIAECAPEYGESFDTHKETFLMLCRDFTFDPDELKGAEEIAGRVSALAKAIVKMSD